MCFRLGSALQLSLWFAHPAPILSLLKHSGTARAHAPFDTREASSEQQGVLPSDTKPLTKRELESRPLDYVLVPIT